jgi:hypothetical protein
MRILPLNIHLVPYRILSCFIVRNILSQGTYPGGLPVYLG